MEKFESSVFIKVPKENCDHSSFTRVLSQILFLKEVNFLSDFFSWFGTFPTLQKKFVEKTSSIYLIMNNVCEMPSNLLITLFGFQLKTDNAKVRALNEANHMDKCSRWEFSIDNDELKFSN